ncbi:hypothetical protein N9174_03805 [bacterium]|nr:hypothetical protein [bacterium]
MERGFSPALKTVLIILALAVLCAGVFSYKFYLLNKLPLFNPQDGEGFFWTESAFHFRHFQMVAEGAGIPAVDYGIQHPEGLDTVRYITPVMERVAGNFYRLFFSDTPSHLFLVCFSFVFSTLSVLAIFFAGKIAWRSNPAALICAFFYGVTPASLTRTAGGGFIREDFALPFIFSSFACFVFCLRKDKPSVSLLGSLLLLIALSAWHVTQMYVSLFMVGLVVVYFVKEDVTFLSKSYLIFLATMVLAALILPALRAKYFIFSPAMMLGYSLLIVSWVSRKNSGKPTMRNFLVSGLVIVIFFAGSLFIQKFTGSYSHVYELLLYKLRFLGVLPEDPARLSFEAKSMWTSAFVSPKLAELPILLSFSLLFGTVGIGILIYRMITKAAEAHEVLILYFSISMFLLFLMIHRMSVFAVFFMALSMGALTLLRKQYVNYALYFSMGICFLIQSSILPSFKLLASRPDQNTLKNLISFIRTQSAIDTPVLTTFELGPDVAAYAERPVVLHSKFESPQLRDKVKAVYTSLYQSEEAFYELYKRYKAGIFVYQTNVVLGHGPGSIRYVAGAASLETESTAFLFHFAPERLKHFSLIFQNPAYRVFRAEKSAAHETFDIKYQPIYDLANFSEEKDLGKFFDDDLLKPGLRKLRSSGTHLKIGDRFFSLGDYQTAVLQYERALMIDRRNKQAA